VSFCLTIWDPPQAHSPQPKWDNYKINCPFPIHPKAQKPTLLCSSTTSKVKLCFSVWLLEIHPHVHSPQLKWDHYKIYCPFSICPPALKPTLFWNSTTSEVKLCLSVWLFEIRPQVHSPQPMWDNYKINCPYPIRPEAQKPTLHCNSTSPKVFKIRPQFHSQQSTKENKKNYCFFPIAVEAQKPALLCIVLKCDNYKILSLSNRTQ
jgi:hypothetical protein